MYSGKKYDIIENYNMNMYVIRHYHKILLIPKLMKIL